MVGKVWDNRRMRVSLIVTVFNEAASIELLLASIVTQTRWPDEVIIVDGGSNDNTVQKIKQVCRSQKKLLTKLKKRLRIYIKPGNRSLGRNYAISQAKFPWVAMTDAGCVLRPDWLANLIQVVDDRPQTQVVAGYYEGLVTTTLSEAIIPYVLVMPNRITPQEFLPSTRSMLWRHSVWRELGGFDESLSDNEDYDVARRLAEHPQRWPMAFTNQARVVWLPPPNLPAFTKMIWRFARGDAQSGWWRGKVWLVFGRYGLWSWWLNGLWQTTPNQSGWFTNWMIFWLSWVGYFYWSIYKNYEYVPRGWYWLPILQILADVSVMLGTLTGLGLFIWRKLFANHH